MLFWLCVAVRIVATPFSNVVQKALTCRAGPLSIVCVTHGLLSVSCLPVILLMQPPLSAEFWVSMAAAAVLCVAGNALIVEALKLSDLSVLGPINAWKPIVSL